MVIETDRPLTGTSRKRWQLAALSVVAGMSLLGFSAAQPPATVDAATCSLGQSKRLYVGFGKGMGLDNFESTASASVQIVREVKQWACENHEATQLVPSLQFALAHGSVRLDRVQFQDATHAVVLLTNPARPRWSVELAQTEDAAWHVTRNRVASAAELLK